MGKAPERGNCPSEDELFAYRSQCLLWDIAPSRYPYPEMTLLGHAPAHIELLAILRFVSGGALADAAVRLGLCTNALLAFA